mgnify:CR=1 FL=1
MGFKVYSAESKRAVLKAKSTAHAGALATGFNAENGGFRSAHRGQLDSVKLESH